MIEKLSIDSEKVKNTIQKIDHENKRKITWIEFLQFMNKESEKREIINDANIYGCGVKRFQEGDRLKTISSGIQISYNIESIMLMPLESNMVYLLIFENNIGLFKIK